MLWQYWIRACLRCPFSSFFEFVVSASLFIRLVFSWPRKSPHRPQLRRRTYTADLAATLSGASLMLAITTPSTPNALLLVILFRIVHLEVVNSLRVRVGRRVSCPLPAGEGYTCAPYVATRGAVFGIIAIRPLSAVN